MKIKKNLDISIKQTQILILLYRFRFLNTNQIQKFLSHKNPRTAQILLSDLVQKQYVYSNYQRTKFWRNTKPSIFHLLPKAIKILRKQENYDKLSFKNIYDERKRSNGFIHNSLFIADLYLDTKEINGNPNSQFFTKVELKGYRAFPNPLPEAYIAIKEKNKTKRYLVLLLEEKAPLYAYRYKIKKYLDFAQEDTWKESTHGASFPSIYIICPDYRRKRFVKRFIEENYPIKPFFLTTKKQVRLSGMFSKIWDKIKY